MRLQLKRNMEIMVDLKIISHLSKHTLFIFCRLSDDCKNDLRKHHFEMGMVSGPMVTTN